jgi:thioredoxin
MNIKKLSLIVLSVFLLGSYAFAQKKSLPKMNTKMFTEQVWNFKKDKKNFTYLGKKAIIVDFYADWCVPCKAIHPILVELQDEYGDSLTIYQLNIDKDMAVAEAFKLETIPALLFVRADGTKYFMSMGKKSKEEFKAMIESVIFGE